MFNLGDASKQRDVCDSSVSGRRLRSRFEAAEMRLSKGSIVEAEKTHDDSRQLRRNLHRTGAAAIAVAGVFHLFENDVEGPG